MSWNAQRFVSKKELVERDRFNAFFQEQDLQAQSEIKIFCVFGDIWDAACHVFPSLLCPEDEMGAYKNGDIWYTYSSSRQVCVDNAQPAPWVCFGQEGSLIAASELIAYMQFHNCQGWVEFCDGTRTKVQDYVLPDWAVKGTWYSYYYGQQRNWIESSDYIDIWERYNADEETQKMQAQLLQEMGWQVAGDKYYLSTNPNDYLFYEEHQLPDEAKKIASLGYYGLIKLPQWRQWVSKLNSQEAKPSSYASKFSKALSVVV